MFAAFTKRQRLTDPNTLIIRQPAKGSSRQRLHTASQALSSSHQLGPSTPMFAILLLGQQCSAHKSSPSEGAPFPRRARPPAPPQSPQSRTALLGRAQSRGGSSCAARTVRRLGRSRSLGGPVGKRTAVFKGAQHRFRSAGRDVFKGYWGLIETRD